MLAKINLEIIELIERSMMSVKAAISINRLGKFFSLFKKLNPLNVVVQIMMVRYQPSVRFRL